MPKPRVTATDRLSNVIEVVELGRRSGMLSVERGAGPALEEGEIFFANGHPVYATVAGARGRDALAVLARWAECRFAFDPAAAQPPANVATGSPGSHAHGESAVSDWARGAASPYTGPLAPEHSGFWPQQRSPTPDPAAGSFPGDTGGYPYGYGAPAMPPAPSAPQGPPSPAATSAPGVYGQPAAGRPAPRRPRRAPDVRDLMNIVTTYNLSRGHRTILLLADGEHTIYDLARLSSKSADEVSQLLAELEAYGLIYYYS